MSDPSRGEPGLFVKFWGVRGSIPTSGRRFDEYGGHTPCVEIGCSGQMTVIDAGTGLMSLGVDLGASAPTEIDILLSHLHLDHVSGLPFFKPALMADRLLRVRCGNLGGDSAEAALDRLFSPPLFPVGLPQLPGRIEHLGFRAGETLRLDGGIEVGTLPLNHPGGATGYRFDHLGRAVCYISDIEHQEPWPPHDLADFVRGADLVIYDGMFSETEYLHCRGWGHSTWQKGVSLCEAAGVARLAVFHLHPQHDDAQLRIMEAEIAGRMPGAFIAREGASLVFPPRA